MTAPTNPYYQRAFNALAGTLARAKSVLNEFALIQTGFDRIALQKRIAYVVACSDTIYPIEARDNAAFVPMYGAMTLNDLRATLLEPSTTGNVIIDIKLNGTTILTDLLVIDEGALTSVGSASPFAFALESVADDDLLTIEIVSAGSGAIGLIVTIAGQLL